jgi:hypothetical protein
VGHAGDARPVAEGLIERLPEGNRHVLDDVVGIDVEIALRSDGQIEQAVYRDVVQHVIEKADARVDISLTGAVSAR